VVGTSPGLGGYPPPFSIEGKLGRPTVGRTVDDAQQEVDACTRVEHCGHVSRTMISLPNTLRSEIVHSRILAVRSGTGSLHTRCSKVSQKGVIVNLLLVVGSSQGGCVVPPGERRSEK
jgi:hypothetical protein